MITACAQLRTRCQQIGHALGDKVHDGDRWIATTAIRLGCPLVPSYRLKNHLAVQRRWAPGVSITGRDLHVVAYAPRHFDLTATTRIASATTEVTTSPKLHWTSSPPPPTVSALRRNGCPDSMDCTATTHKGAFNRFGGLSRFRTPGLADALRALLPTRELRRDGRQ